MHRFCRFNFRFWESEGLEMAAAIFGYACLTMSGGGDDYFYYIV